MVAPAPMYPRKDVILDGKKNLSYVNEGSVTALKSEELIIEYYYVLSSFALDHNICDVPREKRNL